MKIRRIIGPSKERIETALARLGYKFRSRGPLEEEIWQDEDGDQAVLLPPHASLSETHQQSEVSLRRSQWEARSYERR